MRWQDLFLLTHGLHFFADFGVYVDKLCHATVDTDGFTLGQIALGVFLRHALVVARISDSTGQKEMSKLMRRV